MRGWRAALQRARCAATGALLCALAAAALPAGAAPFAVELGDTRIGLDTPPGFSDANFTGSPRLQELAESLTSASNRILLFAITDGDLRRFMQGDRPEFRRYMVAVTPRGLERERVSATQFARFVGDATRDLGPTAPGEDYVKFLEDKPAGRAYLLRELRRSPDVVSILQGARFGGESRFEDPRYVLTTTTLLWLRGKALSLSVYSEYAGKADLEWIAEVTARWVEELQRLNAR